MALNLEAPNKFKPLVEQAHMVAIEVFRKNSRKYDLAEHEYPKELDMLASVLDGMNESGAAEGAGAAGVRRDGSKTARAKFVTAATCRRCFDHRSLLG